MTDPFFDKPYEATARSNATPAAAAASTESLRKSPNIKSKRVVAALFKSS